MDFTESNCDVTRILLITIFVVLIIGFTSIQDVFAITVPITIPMGAAGGAGNFEPDITKIQKGDTVKWINLGASLAKFTQPQAKTERLTAVN